jgi:galactose mutarotase-like enzyme
VNIVGDTCCAARHEQGFEIFTLSNQDVEVAIVPELGARIMSLKNLLTGREWLWHPEGGLKLFRNEPGDSFERSPLVGIDECFPTIAPCTWQKRNLPDHGELWPAAWEMDFGSWKHSVLRTNISLKISPFDFKRTIELRENEIRLSYRLFNRAATEELYLWAMHPLLQLQPGDQLELPTSTRALLNGADWIDALNSTTSNANCEKLFASPISEGRAAISNPETSDRLEFEWDPARNNTLGLWLNRGGWHGHHHFALEPTNGEPDVLSAAAQRKRCGAIAPKGSVSWQVCIRVGN